MLLLNESKMGSLCSLGTMEPVLCYCKKPSNRATYQQTIKAENVRFDFKTRREHLAQFNEITNFTLLRPYMTGVSGPPENYRLHFVACGDCITEESRFAFVHCPNGWKERQP